MIEGAVIPAARRCPVVHDGGAHVGDKLASGQADVPGGDLVRQTAEVEAAAAQLGHELFFGVARCHGHVRDDFANASALTQRRGLPLCIGSRIAQAGEAQELGGYGRLQGGVIRHGQLPGTRTAGDRHHVRRVVCAALIGARRCRAEGWGHRAWDIGGMTADPLADLPPSPHVTAYGDARAVSICDRPLRSAVPATCDRTSVQGDWRSLADAPSPAMTYEAMVSADAETVLAGLGRGVPSHQGTRRTGPNTDLAPNCVKISRRLEPPTPSHQRPARRYERGPGSATRRDSRDRTQLVRSAAGVASREEKIMIAIKAVSTAPRQRTSPQNGLPDPVPYVYGQHTRRNTYAARIARRNIQEWWQPPVTVPKPKLTRPQAPPGAGCVN
jgi:hypothetical protein